MSLGTQFISLVGCPYIWGGGPCHTHLLELLDLGLLKHGEHIGAPSLYPLLGFLRCLERKRPLDTVEPLDQDLSQALSPRE